MCLSRCREQGSRSRFGWAQRELRVKHAAFQVPARNSSASSSQADQKGGLALRRGQVANSALRITLECDVTGTQTG